MTDAIKAITNNDFISAIFLTIVLISLGFVLRKKHIFTESSKKTITAILMKISLPALAFSGFLIDFNTELLAQSGIIILITVLAYIICLLIGQIIFIKYPKEKRNIYSILISIGQVTLFGLPLVKALYPESGLLVGNIMSIPFRVFVYIYSFIIISGVQLSKATFKKTLKDVFLNPIIIAMLLSIIIWVTQPIAPKVMINDVSYSLFRVDKTLPWLGKALTTVASLTVPLALVLIGVTLGEVEVKKAFTNKLAWIIAIFRSIISPIVMSIIVLLLALIPGVNLAHEMIASMLICFASPVSAVVNTFCINYNKEDIISSDSCFLSTLLLIVYLPIMIILIELIF